MAEGAPDPNKPDSPATSASWLDRHLWQIQPLRDISVIAGVLFVVWLGYVLSIVTVPLLLAIALAYLFEPFVQWLVRHNIFGRRGAATFIIGVIAIVTIVPVGVGGTYAVIQGTDMVFEVRDDAQAFREAIKEENRGNEGIRSRVTGQPWEWLLETIEKDRIRQDELLRELEAQHAEDAGEPITATPTEADAAPLEGEPAADAADPNAEGDAESLAPPVPPAIAPEPDPRPESEPDLAPTGPPAGAEPQTDADEVAAAGPVGEGPEPLAERLERERRERLDRIKQLEEPTDLERTVTLAVAFVENNAAAISSRVVRTGAGAFESFIGLVTSLGVLSFTLFLTCFFFFFVCTNYGKMLKFGESLIPESNHDLTVHLLKRFDGAVSGFIRGRVTIAFIQSFVFAIGYWTIGVPAPLLLGAGVAVLSIVPYAALVGIPISIVLLQLENHTGFRGSIWWILGAPTAFYFVGQALDDYVWTPLIQGKSTGMDTPTILFATLAGGALLGVYGLLLAIPLAACIKILLEEIFWPRFKQWSRGEKPDFLPIEKD